jgi:hypothetical protein
MNSTFVSHTDSLLALDGLSGATTSNNIISSPYYKLRIVDRSPSSGSPAPGVPFSISVEVQTSNNEDWLDIPFWCPDAFVVIKSAHSGRVWTSKYISTRFTNNCTGRDRLIFNADFTPDNNHPVIFEIYKDDNITSLSDTEHTEPIAVSDVVHLGYSLREGRNAGFYDVPYSSLPEVINEDAKEGGLAGLNSILGKATFLVAAGAGIYFLSPFFPAIKRGFKKIAGMSKNDQTKIEPPESDE